MAMAVAGGTRAAVGRVTNGLNAIATMSSLSAWRSSKASVPSSPAAATAGASLRWSCPQLPPSFGARCVPNSVVAMSTVPSSISSVDTGCQTMSSAPSHETSSVATAAEIDALDIRVGRVLRAWKHPEADSLYVEEVDVADAEGPRTICSGLVNYLPLEKLEGRAVVVLANLKARNMRGVKSNGMLLAASNAEHTVVELLSPPEEAAPGERVWFGDESDQVNQGPAGTPNQVQKKKIWESIQPLLKTTDDCVPTFQSKPMRTSAGVVTCESLKQANIS